MKSRTAEAGEGNVGGRGVGGGGQGMRGSVGGRGGQCGGQGRAQGADSVLSVYRKA